MNIAKIIGVNLSAYITFIVILFLSLVGCTSNPFAHTEEPPKIDREEIRQTFYMNRKSIQACYEKSLEEYGKLEGIVRLNFDIGSKGLVLRANIHKNSSLLNEELNLCLITRLKAYTFPTPPENQIVNVIYPLKFSSK